MAASKTEDGIAFPAAAYAYVPDPEAPATWKLRLWESPEARETPRQVGMAVAALGKGFRGNRVQIPADDLPAVKRKVRSAWHTTHPDASEDELPAVLEATTGVVPLELAALAVVFPVETTDIPHPNRVPFSGVLTRIDEPSDRAPSGSRGKRVLLPAAVAEKALPTLIGMAVDAVPGLSDHDARRKVGVITQATIEGRDLKIAGFLYGKDFPDIVQAIQDGARRGTVGASFEVTDIAVEDQDAPVLTLTHCTFTGAAILYKTDAAYGKTAIAASADEEIRMRTLEQVLEDLTKVAAALAATADADADADAAKKKAGEEAEAARAKADAEAKSAAMRAAMGSPLTRHIFGLGLQSLCKAMGIGAEHDDALEDMALLKTLGLVGPDAAASAASPLLALLGTTGTGTKTDAGVATLLPAMQQVVKRLNTMQAALDLVTDAMGTQSGLLTDLQKRVQGLATDDATRRLEDGKSVPGRKTIAATTHEPQWVSKYPEIANKEKWSEAELSALLKQHGVNEEQRMAVKLDLIEAGRLA